MDNFFDKKRTLFLLIISFYFLIFLNWSIDITSSDEGKNAYAVFNMIKTKDFLVPYYNCEFRFEKPPMLYWAGALTSSIFGINEFSLRLVSGLSAMGIIVFLYLIVKEFFEESVAWRSILIFLTLPHIWIEARAFTPEMLLNFFSVGSIYFFLKEKPIGGWLFLAFAVLTKGPVGLVLPLIVVFIFKLTKKDFPILNLLGIVLFLIIGSSWYFYMLYKFGYPYFYKFFLHENLFRFTGKKIFHPYPFYFYLIIILISTFFYLPIYFKIFTKIKSLSTSPIRPFLFWFLFVLIFYSLSKNKLHHYILFAYPPLCVILANFVSEKYVRNVIVFSAFLFLSLFLLMNHTFEKERFTKKAKSILETYEGKMYFYKSDLSSLPFYLKKCIPELKSHKDLSKSFIITKKKYENLFDNCLRIIEAKEFNESFVLLKCP